MDAKAATASTGRSPFPRALLGDLDASVARQVVAAGGDVAMVIDAQGVIRDMALSNADLESDGAADWLDRPWLDTVTPESRGKVRELLRDASSGRPRWREVNQVTATAGSLMLRYVAVDAGGDGRVIAIGRDERATSALQARLVEAQQTLERDYGRLRDAEGRYRLLFRSSSEATIVVDVAGRRVVEANPAAERALAAEARPIAGDTFTRLFDAESQEDAAALLVPKRGDAGQGGQALLSAGGRRFRAQASLFRQERTSYALVRLLPDEPGVGGGEAAPPDLHGVLDRIPDAFVVTDPQMVILTSNAAFLDLTRIATLEQAQGRSLAGHLGRPGLDRNLLLDALRDHGAVRAFRTLLRDDYGDVEDVEVSAAAAPYAQDTAFGFVIRVVERRANDRPGAAPDLRRSVEQMTELVGRTTLKDLVRETTDLVERLCIEAALELTKNNRASAAEVLGLSRQSLYSKLHRFGLGKLGVDED